MIVIIEGVNAAGKTTLSLELCKMGFKRVKPFQSLDGQHWDNHLERVEFLKGVGVEVNTFVEDMFVAETLSKVPSCDVVLDRSLPSAIVYDAIDQAQAERLLDIWIHSLTHGLQRAVYVWLEIDPDAAKLRNPERALDSEAHTGMESIFRWCFHHIAPSIDSMHLNVTNMDRLEVANRVRTFATQSETRKK